MIIRPRRLRHHSVLRELVAETRLTKQDLMLPLFLVPEKGAKNPISSMPGVFQWGLGPLHDHILKISDAGISSVLLFGLTDAKDPLGKSSYQKEGTVQQAIGAIKKWAPHLLVATDVCLCSYTDHGHCGVMNDRTGQVDMDNDATLELLALQALSFAEAGADMVAPSGMVDGAVGMIRTFFDDKGFDYIPIMGYTVKYASSFYGPFRDAADCAPQYGDRRTYQMDFRNGHECLKEAQLDITEGADILMVKPAQNYLDIILLMKQHFPDMPIAAYQVSGEYSMLKMAVESGLLNEKAIMESLTALKRAGASILITYFAEEIAPQLA